MIILHSSWFRLHVGSDDDADSKHTVVFFSRLFVVLAPLAGFTGFELGFSLIGSLIVLLVGFSVLRKVGSEAVTLSSRP